MTVPFILAIVLLTCMFAFIICAAAWQIKRLETRLAHALSEVERFQGMTVGASQSAVAQSLELNKAYREMTTYSVKQVTENTLKVMAASNELMKLQFDAQREAVKVAWSPQPATPPGPTPAQGYQLPLPQYANAATPESDTDPTDGIMDEMSTGRHDGGYMPAEGELVRNGAYLGIPGLTPPPGALSDAEISMLDHSQLIVRT